MGLWNRLFGSKSSPVLWEKMEVTPEKRKVADRFFKGLGSNEIVAAYKGSHGDASIKKVMSYVGIKKERIRCALFPGGGGTNLLYIRGTFSEEDAHYCVTELKIPLRDNDDIWVSIPKNSLDQKETA